MGSANWEVERWEELLLLFLGFLVEQWGGDGNTSSSGGFNNRRTREAMF